MKTIFNIMKIYLVQRGNISLLTLRIKGSCPNLSTFVGQLCYFSGALIKLVFYKNKPVYSVQLRYLDFLNFFSLNLNINLFKLLATVFSLNSYFFYQFIAIYLGIIFMAILNIMYINLLFPSLLLFNGEDGEDNSSNNPDSEDSYGSDEDPEDEDHKKTVEDDPENKRTVLRDNPHRAENIMDDWDEVVKAKEGNQDSLNKVKAEYSAFFETSTDEEALRQIEDYLEEEYDYGRVEEEEEREADELDEIVKQAKETSGKRAHTEENDLDSPEVKRQRLWDSNDNNNGRGPGGGFSGPNSSGNGPESNGPGPESSSTSSSKIIDILLGLLLLGGGILDNITEVFNNLFC